MRAQETQISVALSDDRGYYPQEVWDLCIDHLDMYTEEILDELGSIAWAEGNQYPNNSSIAATTGQLNWGASGSYSEILMQVSTGTAGGVGATAIAAAIKVAYEKIKSRARVGAVWDNFPSADQAEAVAKSRLHQHYGVMIEKLTVTRSDVNTETRRYELELRHEDGRTFGAVFGAIESMPSCTRIWADGEPMLRPEPTLPEQGN
ncbi:hypothetical protein [Streptomyces sp. NBC_00649]|uniref:hypothetical protein n=1 Tax=Streptomyces sp. NBC_00649 TaxID=2975798 RepID=UPI0032534488